MRLYFIWKSQIRIVLLIMWIYNTLKRVRFYITLLLPAAICHMTITVRSSGASGSVQTRLEKIENEYLTLKAHQMFSVLTKSEELKNATITGHFGFVFEKNSVREITRLSRRYVFEKFRVRDVLVWTVGLTVEIYLHFQISPAQRGCCLRLTEVALLCGDPN